MKQREGDKGKGGPVIGKQRKGGCLYDKSGHHPKSWVGKIAVSEEKKEREAITRNPKGFRFPQGEKG